VEGAQPEDFPGGVSVTAGAFQSDRRRGQRLDWRGLQSNVGFLGAARLVSQVQLQ
jgi:hypothetical protein